MWCASDVITTAICRCRRNGEQFTCIAIYIYDMTMHNFSFSPTFPFVRLPNIHVANSHTRGKYVCVWVCQGIMSMQSPFSTLSQALQLPQDKWIKLRNTEIYASATLWAFNLPFAALKRERWRESSGWWPSALIANGSCAMSTCDFFSSGMVAVRRPKSFVVCRRDWRLVDWYNYWLEVLKKPNWWIWRSRW